VTTTGASPDPDGYSLDLQGPSPQTRSLPASGITTFTNLSPGQYTVELGDVSANCAVSPGASRSVAVVQGDTVGFGFAVACSDPQPGTRIAFASDRDGDNQVQDIYVMDADGANLVRVTSDPASDDQPAWSPDGSRIVFMSERDGTQGIFVMNADGSGVVRLTSDFDTDPAWSPDGSRIAFSRYVGEEAMFIMNADGSGANRFTDQQGFAPRWSPDGGRIAFTCTDGRLCLIDADGNNFVAFPMAGLTPDWSPDGSSLVFEGFDSQGDTGLFLIDADGSGLVQLTANRDRRPSWSPDGTRIAFDREVEPLGEPDVHTISPDGTGVTRLTTNPTEDRNPAWSPS
jgi:Tol biopolymer transport system component